ncbi:MAG TPA: hypothetical protein VFP46_02510 [Candidatus Paceibacterota bacterium]|nr:hypothetical protein [Candidatus Paceibacterota bacterium]
MRRTLFFALLILSALAGGTFFGHIADAQSAGCTSANVGTKCNVGQPDEGFCMVGGDGSAYCQANALQTPADSVQASNSAVQNSQGNAPTTPNLPGDQSKILANVMSWIAAMFAYLVAMAMIALNYAMYYTVIKMGSYIHDLSAVGVTWRILRDVGNIMLIFGFLASGIMVMFDSNQYGFGSKLLPKLLIAAIFINFSLFFAEAIVDTGNLFATQIYTQINGGKMPTLETAKSGIAEKIMERVGILQLYNNVRNDQLTLIGGAPIFVGFMSIILFIVISFVMFSLAFILVARFVVLLLLLIVAPVGFAGWAIPSLNGISKKWWSTLVGQTMTAPVLLLLLYVAVSVITDPKFLGFGGDADWLGLTKGTLNMSGYASTLLAFLVAMGLLLVVLTVAKSMSALGAGLATKTTGSLMFGTTAWLGRRTGGALAMKGANALRKTKFARVPLVGTRAVKGLEKIGTSSFDVRGSTGAATALKTFKIEAGSAQKGGYKEDLKKSVESRTKYAAELKGTDFKDLTTQQQAAILDREKELARLKKEKTEKEKSGKFTAEDFKFYTDAIERAEHELDLAHADAGTERGNKFDYASRLANLPLGFSRLASNKDAVKKIKEDARKTKDDKDIEALKKALKKVGGEEEEKKPETPKPEGGGAASGTGGPAH